jgi:putative ABC transport system permease protein
MMAWLHSSILRSFTQFRSNMLRTFLTLLGMVFGVGSVVAMVSIGEGAQREILAAIDAMGADVAHIKATTTTKKAKIGDTINDSVGLHRSDVSAVQLLLPTIDSIAFRAPYELGSTDLDMPRNEIRVVPVSRNYFKVHRLRLQEGRPLLNLDHENFRRVAILGSDLAQTLFPEGAIGKQIRLEYAYFQIVGVLERASAAGGGDLPISPALYNKGILLPFETANEELRPAPAHGELELISLRVKDTRETLAAKELLVPAMLSLHGKVEDFEVIAPEEILQQRQAAQAVLNLVLICIAAISLLVGGIGVMNIMLANIMERISEIGLRRAVGARKRDIRNQFLLEAVVICFIGGLIGIALGLTISFTVGLLVDLPVAFSWISMALAFGISVLVGIIFGLMPALRAANINPIEALQSE